MIKNNYYFILSKKLFLILIISIVCALFFNLSPLIKYFGKDSSVFLYIGKMMHNGLVPYVDLFDHKGVFLYFIEYIGTFFDIVYCGFGVWLLEIINLFFFILSVFKISELFTKSKIVKVFVIFLIPIIGSINIFAGGNNTEEYALPWVGFSFFYFFRYIKQKQISIYNIIFIGISLGIVFFLRVNLIITWIAFLPLLLVYFIYKKKWNEILFWLKAIIIGLLIIFLIVYIYGYFSKSLNEMISCYLKFNILYSKNQIDLFSWFLSSVKCLLKTIIGIPVIILGIFYKDKKYYLINFYYLAVCFLLFNMSGRGYRHYAIILIPCFILFAIFSVEFLLKIINKLMKIQIWRNVIVYFILFIILLGLFFTVSIKYKLKNETENNCISYISNNSNVKDDVLILGNYVFLNLASNRKTHNRYFYQTPPINISDSIYKDFLNELQNNKSDLILLPIKKEKYLKNKKLSDKNNFQKVYYDYLGNLTEKGIYKCEIYEDFVVWKLVRK